MGTNEKYDTEGVMGTYRVSSEPFRNPSDVKVFDGFGADKEDLERGYCEAHILEPPDYSLQNYKDRYSMPKRSDTDQGNMDAINSDWEFRDRERMSQGFLTRPRIPTERG